MSRAKSERCTCGGVTWTHRAADGSWRAADAVVVSKPRGGALAVVWLPGGWRTERSFRSVPAALRGATALCARVAPPRRRR